MDSQTRHKGKIKWFSEEKGYGFIVPALGGGDVFVHASQTKHLTEAQLLPEASITYSLKTSRKGGEEAINLKGV